MDHLDLLEKVDQEDLLGHLVRLESREREDRQANREDQVTY